MTDNRFDRHQARDVFGTQGKHGELRRSGGSPCLLERCILEVRPAQVAGQQACGLHGRVRNASRANRLNAPSPSALRRRGQFFPALEASA